MLSRLLDMPITEDQSAALREAAERVDTTKTAFDTAKAERERLIHDVALAGASYREIAEEAGMSHQRVHQLLTGEKPPKMPYGIDQLYHCPRCEATPGQRCKDENGKPRRATHIERSNRALHIRLEELEEPREDEPGPLTALFRAIEKVGGLGFREDGPIYTNHEDAAAYVRTLSDGSYVGQWTGHRFDEVLV